MSRTKKRTNGKHGVLWNMLGSTMYAAVTFITLFFVSRFQGAAAAGVFSIAFTTAQMLYFVGIFGAHSYHMTDYRQEHSLRDYARLRCLTCVLMAAACAATLPIMGFAGEKALLTLVLTGFMLTNALAELWQSQFFRMNRLDLSGQSLFFRNLFSVGAFAMVMILWKNAIYASCAALFVNGCATAWYGPWRFRQISDEKIPESGASLKVLWRQCFPLFISSFLISFLHNCSKYIIEFLGNDEMLGHFSMIMMPVPMLNLAMGYVLTPAISSLSKYWKEENRSCFCKRLKEME